MFFESNSDISMSDKVIQICAFLMTSRNLQKHDKLMDVLTSCCSTHTGHDLLSQEIQLQQVLVEVCAYV